MAREITAQLKLEDGYEAHINNLYSHDSLHYLVYLHLLLLDQNDFDLKQPVTMQFSTFLFATLALAVSSAWAKDATSDDDPTCLTTCRDDPYPCQGGWVSTQLDVDDEVCVHSNYPSA